MRKIYKIMENFMNNKKLFSYKNLSKERLV